MRSGVFVVAAAGSGGGLPGRTLGVLGLFWPSKKFADEELIPKGAASTGLDVEDAALKVQLDSLKDFFDADTADSDLDALTDLIEDIGSDPEARESFFRTARGLIGPEGELDPDDRFGGIGANGARHTPQHVEGTLEDSGTPYEFEAGKLYNLLADDHISNHSDVHGTAVANAIVEAIDSTGN